MLRSSKTVIGGLAAGALLLAGCGGGTSGGSETGGGDTLTVLAGFYPLQYVAEQVGGEQVEVSNITKPGAEPHDLELAPRDVGQIAEADLVVYLKDFQPALDAAVAENAADTSLDVAAAAKLEEHAEEHTEAEDDHGHADEHDHAHEGEDHAHESEGGHEHVHTGPDPHFWLDPTRLALVADAVAAKLGEVDPDNAETYTSNAATLKTSLDELDQEFSTGLATCQNKNLVTSHAAFGYLTDRYGLTQASVSGVDPSQEPSPAQLAALADFVRDNQVTTIYTETLVSPAIAETLARETGAKTAVLDPIEGLTDESSDYVSVMKTNLETLKAGQSCS